METKKIVRFSDSEVNEGIRYSRSIHGFEVDKRFLLGSANLVLERMKQNSHYDFHANSVELLVRVLFDPFQNKVCASKQKSLVHFESMYGTGVADPPIDLTI